MKQKIKKAVINIKTDPSLKKAAQKHARDLGLSLSAVINNHLRQFISVDGVQFEKEYRMTKKLEDHIEKIHDDVINGRNMSPVLSTPEEIRKYLEDL